MMTETLTNRTPETISLVHERVDDIPVLIELAKRLELPEILEQKLGTHGHQKGLDNGWLTTVWLAFILSQGDHAKYSVEPWVEQRHQTLQNLVGQNFAPSDFNDDRLGVVLRRLGRPRVWDGIEEQLWKNTVAVYKLQPEAVWLDTTTASGHHEPQPGGLMQNGHSKDHRPDLAQLKLMAAVAQPLAQLMATEVHPGNAADDPLYVPMIKRVRRILARSGMLYVGDSKMAALSTRAELVRAKDLYLVPLPRTGKTAELLPQWIEEALGQAHKTQKLLDDNGKELGVGYEMSRPLSTELDGKSVEWEERVLLVRSLAAAAAAVGALEKRLSKAEKELFALTPEPGPGRRQHRKSQTLDEAIAKVLGRNRVEGLLAARFEFRPQAQARSTKLRPRYEVSAVLRQQQSISEQQQRLGWRAYATNAKPGALPMDRAVVLYRQGWAGERDFHLLKDFPLGISPLHVRNDDQIAGLTCLLTLALRLMTLIQIQVREALKREGDKLQGLYQGNPRRATDKPTGMRLLRAIARAQVTLTRVQLEDRAFLHLTPLPPLLLRILQLLDLSPSIYECVLDSL